MYKNLSLFFLLLLLIVSLISVVENTSFPIDSIKAVCKSPCHYNSIKTVAFTGLKNPVQAEDAFIIGVKI
jgi:hypothetical protein